MNLKLDKMNTKKIGMLVALVGSFFIFITFTGSSVSKDKTIRTFIEAYESQDLALLKTVLSEKDNHYTDAELQAFMDYLHSHESNFRTFIREATEDPEIVGEHPAFLIKKEEATAFTKRYVVAIKPFEVTFRTEDYVKAIKWNGTSIPANERIQMIPSVLSVNLHMENNGVQFIEEQEINLDPTHRSEHFYIDITSTKFVTIDTNFRDTILYVNGELTSEHSNRRIEYGPVPFDGSVTVSIAKEFPWGTIVSHEVPITNRKEFITIDTNEAVTKQLTTVVTEYTESLLAAWHDEDTKLMKHVEQEILQNEQELMQINDIPRSVLLERVTIERIRIDDFYRNGLSATVFATEIYQFEGETLVRNQRYSLAYKENEANWNVFAYGYSLPDFLNQ